MSKKPMLTGHKEDRMDIFKELVETIDSLIIERVHLRLNCTDLERLLQEVQEQDKRYLALEVLVPMRNAAKQCNSPAGQDIEDFVNKVLRLLEDETISLVRRATLTFDLQKMEIEQTMNAYNRAFIGTRDFMPTLAWA
jgi:hypothetical protein